MNFDILFSVLISAGSWLFHICIVLGRKLFLANDVLNRLISLKPRVVDSRVSLVNFPTFGLGCRVFKLPIFHENNLHSPEGGTRISIDFFHNLGKVSEEGGMNFFWEGRGCRL